jgi:hypothetical protein
MANEKVELILWDPKSPEHADRMLKQRVACGWRYDEVEEWQLKQIKGTKCLYWIVS